MLISYLVYTCSLQKDGSGTDRSKIDDDDLDDDEAMYKRYCKILYFSGFQDLYHFDKGKINMSEFKHFCPKICFDASNQTIASHSNLVPCSAAGHFSSQN